MQHVLTIGVIGFSIFFGMITGGCGEGRGKGGEFSEYKLLVKVEHDRGDPVANAIVTVGDSQGRTDVDGSLSLALRGRDGQAQVVSIRCPSEGVGASEEGIEQLRSVVLRDQWSLSRDARIPTQVRATCKRDIFTKTVVVRTKIPNLPIAIDGVFFGKTDGLGVAHLSVQREGARGNGSSTDGARSDAPFHVVLDTKALPMLRPQNPSMTFTFSSKSAIAVFDQKFSIAQKPKRKIRRRKKPVRVRRPQKVSGLTDVGNRNCRRGFVGRAGVLPVG